MKKIRLTFFLSSFLMSTVFAQYGSNVALNSSVTRSNSDYDVAANLVDGQPGNRCAINKPTGWYVIDLGDNNLKQVQQYTIYPYAGGAHIIDWTFEGSNDNSSWEVLDTQIKADFSTYAPKAYNFKNSNRYRYYRLNVTKSISTYFAICELELREATVTGIAANNAVPVILTQPNPVLDDLIFVSPIALTGTAQVYNASGSLVLEKDLYENKVNLSNLETGMYFIKIGNQQVRVIKK